MALLTSYRWGDSELELNDRLNYLVPFEEDTELDSLNEANASFGYRFEATPFALGATLQEGRIVLPIHVLGNSRQQIAERCEALKREFATEGNNLIKLKRKRPWEPDYKYLMCRVVGFRPKYMGAQVEVTLVTEDRRWQEEDATSVTFRIFDSLTLESHVLNYPGHFETEPTITFEAVTPSTNSFEPQWFREVKVYIHDGTQALNQPVMLVSGWDTSTLVAGSKIRSDGQDISVVLENVGTIGRIVAGTTNSRKVWAIGTQFANKPRILVPGSATTPAISNSQTSIPLYCPDGDPQLATSGTVSIDDEIIAYTGVTYQSTNKQYFTLTGCTRGSDSTAAATHVGWSKVKRPYLYTIRYGYGAGFEQVFGNNMDNAPYIDYDVSTNKVWTSYRNVPLTSPSSYAKPFTWGWVQQGYGIDRPRSGEYVVGYQDTAGTPDGRADRAAFYGAYKTDSKSAGIQRLVMSVAGPRLADSIQVKVSLTGTGNYAAAVALRKVSSGFNTTTEVSETIWSASRTTGSPAVSDSGTLFVNQYQRAATHYVLDCKGLGLQPPINSSYYQFATITETTLTLDSVFGGYPVAGSLGAEKGPTTGDFPVYLDFWNETAGDGLFSIYGPFRVGEEISLDCDARAVTGKPISIVSYVNPVWLRLLPGNNTLKFQTMVGTGALDVTITYRAKY